jgi:DNA-binding CsgD family transcriptional regulator
MAFYEKRVWKILAFVGLVITSISLAVSMFQFFLDDDFYVNSLRKIDRILINLVAFGCFVYLFLNPQSFRCYAFLFYFYGLGNLYDRGGILAVLCLGCAYGFLRTSGFFRRNKKFRTVLFFVFPAILLVRQYFVAEDRLDFWISIMHIVAAVYIGSLIFSLIYPMVAQSKLVKNEKILERGFYTQRDVEFLSSVLDGKKYKKIATLHDVSESTVKARMVELYKFLDVKDRTEFLAVYRGYSFKLN